MKRLNHKNSAGYWALLASIAASSSLAACAGVNLRKKAGTVAETIAVARKNGAQECAPVELAMAESHHDFAITELDEGDYFRAKEELEVAENNANQALELSPEGRCVKRKRKVAKPTPKDSDGDGIPNITDDCPRRPEDFDDYKDADGCPEPDNDLDGLVDKIDKCPNDPEDKDGFEDDDGCPDVDNDDDGLSDRIDSCPDQPEDDDGFEDDDGCPDCDNDKDGVPECPEPLDKCPDQAGNGPDGCPQKHTKIVVKKDKIELLEVVLFDTNKSTIKPVSFGLLNEVAEALKEFSKIKVRIEGHTDSRGRDRKNLRLSQKRAESVKAYLVAQGIAAERMDPKGFGETVPIASNRTKQGRQENRRVEFVITSR